jgi:methionine-rich copper-binding protein CopC
MKKIFFIIFLFLIIPQIVCSHAYLQEISPSEDAVLTTPPKKVTLSFAGSVEPALSKIEVFDQGEKKVSLKTRFLEDNRIMEVELFDELNAGEYSVKWFTLSLDGHKQRGSYKFTIK